MNAGQRVRLGDVCAISSALIDPRRAQYLHMPHVGGANIESTTGKLIALRSAEEEGLKSGKFLFDERMVLYSKIRPYLMKVARPDFRGLCSADIYPLSPIDGRLDRTFLFHLLLAPTFTEYAITGSARAGMPKVNRDHLFAFEFQLPPLPEQQRIVGILDEAFEGIATAKANAEKNLQNARALFESHLQSVFAEAWQRCELVTLSNVAADITDGDHLPPPKAPTGVPFITIGNIAKDTRKIDFADTFMVPRAYFDGLKPNRKPRRGDLLYTVTGSFGIPVIVDGGVEFCFQRHIGLIRPKPETDSSWLYYLLLSPQVLKQANERATGAAQKTVSLKALRGFTVPHVPLPQQRAAVTKLDALSEETQRLASIYERKLTALEALKKSLLHQAFSGQL